MREVDYFGFDSSVDDYFAGHIYYDAYWEHWMLLLGVDETDNPDIGDKRYAFCRWMRAKDLDIDDTVHLAQKHSEQFNQWKALVRLGLEK